VTIEHPSGSPPSGLDVQLRRPHAHSIFSQQAGMSGFQQTYSIALTTTYNGGSSDAGLMPVQAVLQQDAEWRRRERNAAC
jgi:hypothetical protein